MDNGKERIRYDGHDNVSSTVLVDLYWYAMNWAVGIVLALFMIVLVDSLTLAMEMFARKLAGVIEMSFW